MSSLFNQHKWGGEACLNTLPQVGYGDCWFFCCTSQQHGVKYYRIFTNSSPLGRVGLVVGMSVYIFIYIYTCPLPMRIFVRPHIGPDLTCELFSHGASKTRRCSGLDSWMVPAWSLKSGEVFRIGLDFMVTVLLSASVKRVDVSIMRDFYESVFSKIINK